MSDNKKYYYLKLKDTHFDDERIIVLESLPDGILYSNIYLKLCLKSVKREGKLMFNDRIPYNSQILAQVTRHPVGVVEKAIQILKDFDLIEVLDNGAIYINDIQNYIGTSSTEADRKREYRSRIDSEKENLLEDGQMSGQMSDECQDKSPPEKEIKKERELEKDIVVDIIDHLNFICGTKYGASTKKTKDFISARIKDGYKLEDFKTVINKKHDEWINTDMQKYLRPQTLFGTNFESYLNQLDGKCKQETKSTGFINGIGNVLTKNGGLDDDKERNGINVNENQRLLSEFPEWNERK